MTLTQDATSQAAMTPDEALRLLLEGNRRFCDGQRLERDLNSQVQATRKGQWPYAVVLSCIDSRASAELILDAGIGDLFSVRIAGNFVNDDILGSIEFGCKVAGARLLMVLGHTHCGAIKGACDRVELGHLTTLLEKLGPAVERAAAAHPGADHSSANSDFVQAVARTHVALTVDALRTRSPILRELEEDGVVRIVGAMYDIETGAVSLLD